MAGIDSYTKLLLHCDGADASTTFTDSATGKTVTAVGNTQIDTAQSKFGGASGLFDGTGDYLTLADSDDWYFGTGAFTIDFWVRFAAVSVQGLIHHIADGTHYWMMAIDGSNLIFTKYDAGSETINIANAWTPSISTWYHVAFVRTGNNFMMFIGGTQIGSTQLSTYAISNYAGLLRIGVHTTGAHCLNGWMDEIRVSKGIARWTANFTPPAEPYERFIPRVIIF